MGVDIAAIIKILEKIIALEGKVEDAIDSETDKKKRKKIEKAFKDRDCDALRDLLWDD